MELGIWRERFFSTANFAKSKCDRRKISLHNYDEPITASPSGLYINNTPLECGPLIQLYHNFYSPIIT